jgi:hypothetical protein
MAVGERPSPSDPVGGLVDRIGPVAVGRRVSGAAHDLLAAAGQVPEPDLQAIDAEPPRGLVHLGFEGPRHLRGAEAAQRRGRWRMRQQSADVDARVGNAIWPACQVAALRDHAVTDVGVRSEQTVRHDVLEGDRAVVVQARSDPDLEGRAAHGLEGLLERQHQPHRASDP